MKTAINLLCMGLLAWTLATCDGSGCNTGASPTRENMESVGTLPGPVDYLPGNVVVLAIDYTTSAFMGGYTVPLGADARSFALEADFRSPGDFGGVTIYEKSTHTRLFEGTIVWSGTGNRVWPEEIFAPDAFAVDGQPRLLGDPVRFSYDEREVPFDASRLPCVRRVVERLSEVRQAVAAAPDAPVYAMLYARSVGAGNPAEWYWLVFVRG